MHCPTCDSFNEEEAVFCSQCGRRLWGIERPVRIRLRLLSVLLVLAAIWAVLYVLNAPEERAPVPSGVPEERPVGSEKGSGEVERPPSSEEGPMVLRAEEDELEPLDAAEVARRVLDAIVVLDLRAEGGRPLREERGVIVDATGVVLTRYRSLLGAHRGVCRLSDSAESRVEVVGVSYREPISDLALVRIKRSAIGYPMVPILSSNIPPVVDEGEPLFVLSGSEALAAQVSEPFHLSDDGLGRVRLAETPEVPADAFVAADAYGFLVGLCRPEIAGKPLMTGRALPTRDFRIVVDPASSVRSSLTLEANLSLYDLTRREYEGTFADLFARGTTAFKQGRWLESVDLLSRAVDRSLTDAADGEDVEAARRMLRESYLEEMRRLFAANRLAEAADTAEAAASRYPGDTTILAHLAEILMARGEWLPAVEALRQARAIEPRAALDELLEECYLRLAAESARLNDIRAQESNLLSGVRDLPSSGSLLMELAVLYANLGAYNDAIGLCQRIKEVSREHREAADALLEKIDDILKRREAVVIPIEPDSRAIRTTITVDGVRQLSAIIDTGATYTALPERLVRELRYDLNDRRKWPEVVINTAAGPMVVRRGQVQSVNLGGEGGYSVRNLEVLALPQSGEEFGLIGLNFLKHFKYTVDTSRREFRLERQ